MRISVIIPSLNEARQIGHQIDAVLAQPGFHEIIVVDGHSDDDTAAISRRHGARVVTSDRGRSQQMNAGARASTGEVLFFLHADVGLPDNAAQHIVQALSDGSHIAGAFRTWTYDDPRASGAWRLGPLLHLADIRSRVTRHPYGDQGLFLLRDDFDRLGGFPDVPLMEDLMFSRTLAAHGSIARAKASVAVSGRRWQLRPLFTTAVMNLFPLALWMGIRAQRLADLYEVIR